MLKNFFSSVWPTIVVLCLGLVTFVVGNFFGYLLPEGWLVPLAWVSSMAFCVGLVLAVVACAYNGSNWFFARGGVLFCMAAFLLAIWRLMLWGDVINKEFVDIDIFRHPVAGGISIGLLLLAFGPISIVNITNKWRTIYAILFAFFIGGLAVILATEWWILPLDQKVVDIIGTISILSMFGMIIEIIIALCAGKINEI